MNVQAEVSVYPLRAVALMASIERFLGPLRRGGVRVEVGPMSSRLADECGDVFRALGELFEAAARESDVVGAIEVADTCPEIGGRLTDGQQALPTAHKARNKKDISPLS